jgi:hypothetical protein
MKDLLENRHLAHFSSCVHRMLLMRKYFKTHINKVFVLSLLQLHRVFQGPPPPAGGGLWGVYVF